MAKIICNSGPIIGLSIIEKLYLLWEIFDEVIIPEEVYNEIVYGSTIGSYGINELKKAVEDTHVAIYKVKNELLVNNLYGRLHKGELEVIIAAKELGIKNVVLDDRLARNFAETMLLKPIGIIGILILAKEIKKILEIRSSLHKLMNSGYRISIALYNEALRRANEI